MRISKRYDVVNNEHADSHFRRINGHEYKFIGHYRIRPDGSKFYTFIAVMEMRIRNGRKVHSLVHDIVVAQTNLKKVGGKVHKLNRETGGAVCGTFTRRRELLATFDEVTCARCEKI